MKLLAPLLQRLERSSLLLQTTGRPDNLEIDRLDFDSREVGPRSLFVAIRGEQVDGHQFIDKAVQNGANAVVCEAMPEEWQDRFPGIVFARVANARAALAELAAALFDDPSRALILIGITGTNGKTTTAFLVHHLLSRCGIKAGLLGTVETRIGDEKLDASLTTPDPIALNRLLRRMVDAACDACVMEVSSHALDQERVRALHFDVALFTNLTQDHLDYHPTFDHYLSSKKKLFDHLSSDATAIYNLDDASAGRMMSGTAAETRSYGKSEGADVEVEVVDNSIEGLRLRLDGREGTFRLVGNFNAYNIAAAYGIGLTLGLEADAMIDCLGKSPPVPGRFEQIRFDDGTTVVVDYAHTPDALENVLRTVNDTKSEVASTWCVFGCGGDRDAEKRPLMGRVAERFAAHVIVTSDNPRTEDPEAILADIRGGMERPDQAIWIVDRRKAIAVAAERSKPGDVVVVAGKGHEAYQIVGTEKKHFDDREEVRRAFSSRADH